MRKALVILVALAFAAPLYASSIAFTDLGGGDIGYVCTGEAAVAMGLDVDVLVGGPITAVAISDSFFEIFMDQAFDEEAGDGYVYGEDKGNGPVAKKDQAGQLALPQSEFCISMGGLGGELAKTQDPCMTGTITLTGTGTGTLDENALRGGCIDVNGDTMTTNLPLPFVLEDEGCFTRYYATGTPQYILWDTGTDGNVTFPPRPDCWCFDAFQCGDTNGDCGINIADDIMTMVVARAGGAGTYNPCADVNYDGGVNIADDIMTAVNHRAGTGGHSLGVMDCLDGTCSTGQETDLVCDQYIPEPVEALQDGNDD